MSIRTITSLWRIVSKGHVTTTSGIDRKCYFVWHFEGGGNVVDTSAVKGNVGAFFNVHGWKAIATRLHVDWTADGLWIWKMSEVGDSLQNTGAQLSGMSTGSRLPLNQAVFGYTGGSVRGPSWHGSKRYGPIASLDVVDDELTALAHTRWESAHQAACNPMVIPIGALFLTLVPVIYSRQLSGSDPTVGPNWVCDLNTTYCDLTLSQWRHRREPTQL